MQIVIDVQEQLAALPRRSRARKVLENIAFQAMTKQLAWEAIERQLDRDIKLAVDDYMERELVLDGFPELRGFPADGGLL